MSEVIGKSIELVEQIPVWKGSKSEKKIVGFLPVGLRGTVVRLSKQMIPHEEVCLVIKWERANMQMHKIPNWKDKVKFVS